MISRRSPQNWCEPNPNVIVVRTAGVADVVLKYTRTIPIVALAAGAT